jgi:hypothetical protein
MNFEFSYTTGQVLTAQIFLFKSDTVVGTALAVGESTNRKSRYVANFGSLDPGDYLLIYFLGGVAAGSEIYRVVVGETYYIPMSEQLEVMVSAASAVNIYDYFTAGTRADAFKADISGLYPIAHIQSGVPVERSPDDTRPITFSFPGPALTLVGTRSVNNAAYEPVDGTITYLRTEGLTDLYTLAYHAADRPATEGTVRYRFVKSDWVSGDQQRFVTLRVTGEVDAGDATAQNQQAILSAIIRSGGTQY